MKKGDVVVVTSGKKQGQSGEVFFLGKTQFGFKVGFKDASGTKVWVTPDQCALVTEAQVAPEPTVAAPAAVKPAVKPAPADGMTPQQRWEFVLLVEARLKRLEEQVSQLLALTTTGKKPMAKAVLETIAEAVLDEDLELQEEKARMAVENRVPGLGKKTRKSA